MPARPRTTQPAVRVMVDDARELIGSAVCPTLGPELIVGNETTVGAAAPVSAPVSEAAGGAAIPVEAASAGGAGGS